jgi:hypothetical protein
VVHDALPCWLGRGKQVNTVFTDWLPFCVGSVAREFCVPLGVGEIEAGRMVMAREDKGGELEVAVAVG